MGKETGLNTVRRNRRADEF